MKYRARPVIVEASIIVGRGPIEKDGSMMLELDDGRKVRATASMMSRCFPNLNDYWVIQEDGYAYLNPRDVFERKYQPLEENHNYAS